jgi:RimJ/RimL family protein N-acetyltransferase
MALVIDDSTRHAVDRAWRDRLGVGVQKTDVAETLVVPDWDGDGLHLSLLVSNGSSTICLDREHTVRFAEFLAGREPTAFLLLEFAESIHFAWNPPDLLYYADLTTFRPRTFADGGVVVRHVHRSDAGAFEDMSAACPAGDLDAASVALDDPVVFAAFLRGEMVARASAYEFGTGSSIADLGYVTHPRHRGKGYGAACVRALTAEMLSQGRIPQIRVQPQLHASIGVARTLGYDLWGEWRYDYID